LYQRNAGLVYIGDDPDIFQIGNGEQIAAVVGTEDHIVGGLLFHDKAADGSFDLVLTIETAAVQLQHLLRFFQGRFRLVIAGLRGNGIPGRCQTAL